MRSGPLGLRGNAAFAPTVAAFCAAGFVAFAELWGVQATLPAISVEFDLAPSSAALVQSAGALGLAAAVIPWSLAAQRVRRGTLLRIAVVGTILLSPLVAATDGLPALLAVRCAQGAVLAGVPALAVTHIGDVLDRRRAAAAAGWYVAGSAIGGLSGRLVAGAIGAAGDWRLALIAVSIMSAAAAAAFLLLTPRVVEVRNHHGALRSALGDRRLWTLCALAFLQMGAFVGIYNFIGFRLLKPPLELPENLVTAVFAIYVVGLPIAILSARFVERVGRRRVVAIALAVQTLGAVATLPAWMPTIILGLALVTAAFFMLHAVSGAWVGEIGRGSALPSALYTIAFYMGMGVLGWVVGVVYDVGGWGSLVLAVVSFGLIAGIVWMIGLRHTDDS